MRHRHQTGNDTYILKDWGTIKLLGQDIMVHRSLDHNNRKILQACEAQWRTRNKHEALTIKAAYTSDFNTKFIDRVIRHNLFWITYSL